MASSAKKERWLNESKDSDDSSTSEQASCSTFAPKSKTMDKNMNEFKERNCREKNRLDARIN